MIRNYFKTALRILVRQPAYSGINIFGLTLGIACCLLIILYISDELSYDKFHRDAERIYRVDFNALLNGEAVSTVQTGTPMAEAMMNEAPEVSEVIRVAKWNTYPVRFEDNAFTEKHFLVADSNFFEFFDFKLITGNPKTALIGPYKVVITESAAKKYFGYKGAGDVTPIGKSLVMGSRGETLAEVTAIAQDPPHNSHVQFDFVLSMQSWDLFKYPQIWLNSSVITYFKTKHGVNVADMNARYNYFIEKYCGKEIEQFMNISLAEFKKQGGDLGFSSMPLLDIHLQSNKSDELEANSNIQYLYLFGAIALFIITLACINFMNLSTARSANRAKEVGVRKTVGALRTRLMGQFMLESYLYTSLGVIFALLITALAVPYFNNLSGKFLSISALAHPVYIIGLVLFILIVGLLAGSYPAFYLTSFKPVEVLKGKVRSGMKSSGIRNALVVFQFLISIGLIISTLIVYKQLNFLQSQNLGFDKSNTIDLLHTWNLNKNASAFKQELLSHPEIIGASYANRLPPTIDWSSVVKNANSGQEHLLTIYIMDYDHLKTMGYEMAKGRFFSRDFPSDSSAVIVNETAARQMDFEDFEGKAVLSRINTETEKRMEVIGIMKDFNFESLKNNIRPMLIMLGTEPNSEMAIKLSAGNSSEKLKLVESIWRKYAPQSPFEYTFIDQNFDLKFRSEQRMGQVFIVFTSLAIIIACLGLFGLATFSTEQRAKEISIRKIMGASVPRILFLLTKDFTVLVLISFVLAAPLTWYLLETYWLQSFAYRINFDFMVVLISGVMAMSIALITIGVQAYKSAVDTPVKNLRSE